MTTKLQFLPEGGNPIGTVFPQFDIIAGTNFPVSVLKYDAAADEAACWVFRAADYVSGNLTVDIDWYADTASSGDVMWGAAISVITPDADTQDVETDAFATENTVTDSHLGTVGQRQHRATITVSNLDSLAAEDIVVIRIRRVGSDGADTMAGDACMREIVISYT